MPDNIKTDKVRLQHIAAAIEHIEEFIEGVTKEEYKKDYKWKTAKDIIPELKKTIKNMLSEF